MAGEKLKKVSEPSFYHTTIKEWPLEDRPREKLVQHGASVLTETELLAILIRTGVKGSTAVDLAKKLLVEGRTLRDVAALSVHQLQNLGIGKNTATVLAAAFELARRTHSSSPGEHISIQSPEDAVHLMQAHLQSLKQEEFWALHLNAANTYISKRCITVGILDSSLVHPRECFAEAIVQRASSVIFMHNHPSGNPEPSAEDLSVTHQLVQAGGILGIKVHDHIIIAGNAFTSFADRNFL